MNRYKFCNTCGAKISLVENCTKCNSSRNDYMKGYYHKNKETQNALNSKKWKNFRSMIIKRDKGICQRCFALRDIFISNELQVHHIKPRNKFPELMYDENNVITICKTCNLELGTQEYLDFEMPFKDDKEQYTFHL